MTFEIAFLLALLVTMAILFLTEKLPIEITAFSGLVILVFAGYVPAGDAFSGFSSPAVITMLSMFFLSAALLHTGLADLVGARVHRTIGPRERPLIVAIMGLAGLLSSVMNNVAATAVLLPAVASISHRTGISPSRLFMPLSFGTILGGTLTLVGTPPNILAGEMLRDRGLVPFALFDFLPPGAVILFCGIVFVVIFGVRLLPVRGGPTSVSRQNELSQVYQLHDSTFSIQVPQGSKLDGRTLRATSLGTALGVQVVGVLRDSKRHLAPPADFVLRGGDILLVKGHRESVRELFRVRGTEFDEVRAEDLEGATRRVSGFVATMHATSHFAGMSLRQIDFRARFGAIVIGIRRDGALVDSTLGNEPLLPDDEVIALGTRAHLDEPALQEHFRISALSHSTFQDMHGHLYLLHVPEDSALVGTTIGDSRMGELVGLTVSGIFRGDETLLGLEPKEIVRADDRLLVTGDPDRIRSLLSLGDVHLQQDVTEGVVESDGVGLVEAAIAPRSSIAGSTLADVDFRGTRGVQVLAVWREGELIHDGLAQLVLRFGDALLLQGPWPKIRGLASDRDLLVLSPVAREPRRTKKAIFALGSLALMIGLILSGFQPVHVAAFTAATFVVLTRAITMEEAYRSIEWRAIFLVATILPVGVALERCGAAQLLSETVTAVAGPLGPYGVLAVLAVLSSLLSQTLDGAPAVVLLTPVALSSAENLGISPYTVMMGISLAASAAFMTPFSHKANLLVMGAGAYRVRDYLRVGTPLTILVLLLIVFLVPVFFPFLP
jgi:di/tricarboxylate transporter